MYYSSPEGITIFNALWKNINGTQDKFIAFFDKVSETLANNPYIIGYDPFNEPFPSWNG